MPQYQGIWTLAQAAQLQSTQRWATDPLYRNTTLLLQADNAVNGAQNNTFLDSSTNNFTITRNGNTTQGTFTPYSLQPGAWGNYFNGSTDYISAPNNTVFDFASGDFTVEAWVFVTSSTAGDKQIYGKFAGTNFGPISIVVNSANNFAYYLSSTGSSWNIASNVSGGAVALNTWVHVALVRSGNTFTPYVNGVAGTTTTSSATLFSNTGAVSIGAAIAGATVNYFPGYISNFRAVKGVAVYTGAFTVPTSPLTATQSAGTNISAITGTQTSLLTCQSNRFVDNGTANSGSGFTITPTGTPSVQAFSPFAPQYQYTPSVTGGSGYFDGTGDYLSTPDNAAFDLGTGDFTFECWLYKPNNNDVSMICSAANGLDFAYYQGSLRFGRYPLAWDTTITYSIPQNAWTHIAFVKASGRVYAFANGTLLNAGGTANTNAYDVTTTLFIGVAGDTTSRILTGYMAGVRLIKGQALATASFTPPTAPVTTSSVGWTGAASSITGTVSLLLNFTNAAITDGTLKNNLETVGNAQISTAVVKYGSGSMYFDGTGDYLSIPYNAALVFDSGNFTVECWFYLTGNAGLNGNNERKAEFASCIVGIPTTAGWEFGLDGNSTTTGTGISFSNRINSSTAYVITATVTVNQNQWNHVAVVRNGTTTTIYLNGISVGSGTLTNQSITSANSLWIGRQNVNSFNHDFPGYIDDFRITKGIARYTANFIPPSVALPRQ